MKNNQIAGFMLMAGLVSGVAAFPLSAEARDRNGSSIQFATGGNPVPNVVNGPDFVHGSGMSGRHLGRNAYPSLIAGTPYLPLFNDRGRVSQQSVVIEQPSNIRQSITYEVPTVMGIRNPPVGEPVVYVIDSETKKTGRSGSRGARVMSVK